MNVQTIETNENRHCKPTCTCADCKCGENCRCGQ